MIVKKVKNPRKSASKAARVGGLADYILSPEKDNADEKCIHAGARGFLTDEPHSQKAEMLALAQEAVRSKDPINHYVLSWREGEQPSAAQVEQAVDIFLDELGLTDHQVIYGLHADTDNLHLHVAVNRVHPQTLKVIKPNKGFDIEAAHRAIARIEHVQGWKREQNARYQVLENDELWRALPDPLRPRQPDQPKRDMEQRTGEKSAERLAIEDGAPLILGATSWQQLHRALAAKGMRYEKTGSGATLFVGDVGVKASSAHREASLSKLQKRLGVYEPAPARQPVAERRPEPLQAGVPGWDTYIDRRQAHYAAKGVATQQQAKHEDSERRQLAERQKAHRTVVLQGNHEGRGELRNALQSVIAKEQRAEKAELKARHQQERLRLRATYRPYPDLEQWLRQQQPDLAEDWRRRASAPQRVEGATSEVPTPRVLRWFVAEIHGQEVHYFRRQIVDEQRASGTPLSARASEVGTMTAGRDEVAAFVDKGKVIEIYDWRDRETTRAALEVSAEKWGRFEVRGNDEYKALCISLAVEHGFQVTNVELQERIQAGRQQARQRAEEDAQRAEVERTQASKSVALSAFEAYHQAVGAERYRVTSVRLEPGGRRTTFVLDQDGGGGTGSSPGDVARRISEKASEGSRFPGRSESLHYTPLSEHKHHLLIDGLDAEKLARLMRDGYRPAVVLEIRPGGYQAILTVSKFRAPHDLDIGRRLAVQLNRQYGGLSLTGDVPAGGVQAHPAPGYERRAPGQGGDAGEGDVGFMVRLHQAQGRECITALALAAQIARQYQQEVGQRASDAEGRGGPVRPPGNALQGPAEAYKRHYGDILKRQHGGKVDLSRVDSMIAVRMRITGHGQVEVKAALRQGAPGIRPPGEVRDWAAYAERTARYAYSLAGERQAHDLSKYRERWEQLEGRVPAPAKPERVPDREQESRIAHQRKPRGPSMSR